MFQYRTRDRETVYMLCALHFDELLQKLYERPKKNVSKYPMGIEILLVCLRVVGYNRKRKGNRKIFVKIVVIMGIIWVYEINKS